jgi:hypothetical protein
MRYGLLVLAAILCAAVQAQMLRVDPVVHDDGSIVFNEQFIARNGITAITGERMVKRDNEPMRTRPERYRFRFDADGRISYSNTSYGRPGSGRDTSQVMYKRDAEGHVVELLRNDPNGLYSIRHTLDSAGRSIRETYARVENLGRDRYDVVPGERTEINDEHFRYEIMGDSAWKRITVNHLGLPYREQTYTRNDLGYLVRIEDLYLISNRRGLIRFTYDDKGRLVERTSQPDLGSPGMQRRTFSYDAVGNVLESDLYHDDRHVHHEEFLYEEGTMLVKARLTKEVDTGVIHVVRYRTERR